MKINFKERTPQLIAVIGVLAVVLAILIGFLISNNTKINEMQQQFTIDKQELEDEYEAISLQYEGFKFSVQNDSLLYKLENEQAKVLRLQEELRMTKASDQAEIKRLKDELATLRKILRSYIHQIDSLNRLNEELRAENKQITEQYNRTSRTLTQVSQEKEQLSEKVSLAAQLVATNINAKAVNDRGPGTVPFKPEHTVCCLFHHCPEYYHRSGRTHNIHQDYEPGWFGSFEKPVQHISI